MKDQAALKVRKVKVRSRAKGEEVGVRCQWPKGGSREGRVREMVVEFEVEEMRSVEGRVVVVVE